MIEGRWNASGFTRALAGSLRDRSRKRGSVMTRGDPQRWRRADLLWPDFAPRYED